MEIRHILAANDFSPRADLGTGRAALLARQHEACLHLLHVLPTSSWAMFGKGLFEHAAAMERQLRESAISRLRSLADTYREQLGIAVECYVDAGSPHQRIAEYARSHHIDLTVLGAHAENAVRDLFIGTTALRFVQKGSLPALIAVSVPERPYRKVLVAVDFSEASRLAVDTAMQVAPHAAIHVLHVNDALYEGIRHYAGIAPELIQYYQHAAGEETRRMMVDFLARLTQRDRIVPMLETGFPVRVILDQAQVLDVDLLVMGKHGQSGLNDMFLGSSTEQVLYQADRDLLLVGPR